MDTKSSPVVVAYDFSPSSRAVLERAVNLVTRAPFHVLHFVTVIDPHRGIPVVPRDGKIDIQYADNVRDLMMAELGKVLAATTVANELHFHAHTRIGKPADEILGVAEEIGADLILVGSHGHTGISRLVMGSVAERVVRDAGCPVLVVRPKTYAEVELSTVYEVDRTKPIHTRAPFSYTSHTVVMRPSNWTLMP